MMNHPIPAIYEHGVLRPLVALDRLPEHTQVQIIIVPLPDRTDDKPTMAELWAELDRINTIDYVELELPPRVDRPNPLLEMPQAGVPGHLAQPVATIRRNLYDNLS